MNTQLISDYGKNPANYGENVEANLIHKELNHICGEEMTIYITLDDSDIVTSISFTAEARLITNAAASMLCEALENQPISNIENHTKDSILELLEVSESDLSAKRLKSTTLPLLTILNAYYTHLNKPTIGYEELLNPQS